MPGLIDAPPSPRSRLTLALCTILHAFTHAYGTLLVPLYLLIVADLRLSGVNAAALIVTVYGVVYCLGSYGAGVLADRFDRRALLGIGLVGNAAAVTAMGLTRRYEMVVALGVVAGIAGTLFHPAANALVPAHFPKNPGLAIGLLGAGSGLGFFAGPQYAGWRAEGAHWHFAQVADWQRPCVELGLAGLAFGIAFLLVAREARVIVVQASQPAKGEVSAAESANERVALLGAGFALPSSANGDRAGQAPPLHAADDGQFEGDRVQAGKPAPQSGQSVCLAIDREHALGPALRNRTLLVAAVLGFRDFAGVAGLSLASIYLQKAHGLGARQAGFTVGTMMLLSVVVNPLSVYVTPGRRRLPALAAVLLSGGAVAATVPFVPLRYTLLVLCAFQTCQMGSYAISDAAMLERVAPAVRGRVVGLFLTVAGTFASTGPWVMGFWTDHFRGPRGADPLAYAGPFAVLGAMMVVATFATPLIARLGSPDLESPVRASAELTPATLEPVG